MITVVDLNVNCTQWTCVCMCVCTHTHVYMHMLCMCVYNRDYHMLYSQCPCAFTAQPWHSHKHIGHAPHIHTHMHLFTTPQAHTHTLTHFRAMEYLLVPDSLSLTRKLASLQRCSWASACWRLTLPWYQLSERGREKHRHRRRRRKGAERGRDDATYTIQWYMEERQI